jgi:hypothetical protein
MTPLDRRELMRGLATVLIAPGLSGACASGPDPLLLHSPLAAVLRRHELCTALGWSILDDDDLPHTARGLAEELARSIGWEHGQTASELAAGLDEAIRSDHAQARWVAADGWQLARTEAVALALLTLEAGH